MTWLQKLRAYLKDLLGQEFVIAPLPREKMGGLPLYLTKLYTPYKLELFGKKLILLKNVGEIESPGRIVKDIARLQKHFDMNIAVVFDDLAF